MENFLGIGDDRELSHSEVMSQVRSVLCGYSDNVIQKVQRAAKGILASGYKITSVQLYGYAHERQAEIFYIVPLNNETRGRITSRRSIRIDISKFRRKTQDRRVFPSPYPA